ncbi:MAG: 50S ribosomal protein L32 [Planctomycetota bacterium]|jgi:large subunit ribosomal protein L32
MANPKNKTSGHWRGHRRAHHRLPTPNLSVCPRCNQPKLPHRVCGNCGFYKGEMVVNMKKL